MSKTMIVTSGTSGIGKAIANKLLMESKDKGDKLIINYFEQEQVDQMLTVEPQETAALQIEEGKDYCTLVTCTPYGINTHRLLVRGHRIDNMEEAKTIRVTADAVQIEPLLVAPIVAIPMLLILLVLLLLPRRRRK